VLDRPKSGFPNAVLSWLDAGLAEQLPRIFSAPDSLADRYLPREWTASLVASPEAMRRNWRLVYGVLVLQIWYEVIVRDPRVEPPQETLGELYAIPRRRP
jgi:hypothetical protein